MSSFVKERLVQAFKPLYEEDDVSSGLGLGNGGSGGVAGSAQAHASHGGSSAAGAAATSSASSSHSGTQDRSSTGVAVPRLALGSGSPATGADSVSAQLRRTTGKTTKELIWTTFEEPLSSRLALAVALIVIAAIIVSVLAFVVSTLPAYASPSTGNPTGIWTGLETFCVAIFTLEFVLRWRTCPDARRFWRTPLNIIDFLAIAPFYVELGLTVGGLLGVGAGSSGSAGILRIIRLIRVFRIFKIARYLPWIRVFSNAMVASLQPLAMLVFIVLIVCIVFASAIYYAERGVWSDAAGAFMRTNIDGSVVVSPYQSIPAAMWWCIVTMTTVGYGDVYPVTGAGKFIASLAALSGILVIAIPITVISTNFNAEYAALQASRARAQARVELLRRHFKSRTAGLDAVLDEVDDLVRRNTQEFQAEVEAVFEKSRAELISELQEVVRMAYTRRRTLHLQALAAAAGSAQGPAAH